MTGEHPNTREAPTTDERLNRPAEVSIIDAFKALAEEIDSTGVYLDAPKDAVKFIAQCVSSALTKLIQREASPAPRTLEDAARTSQYWKSEHAAANQELERYKQALTRANGFLIMHNLEPVKLEYSSDKAEVST